MILSILTTGYTLKDTLLLIGVRTHIGKFRSFTSLPEFLDYFLSTDDKIVIGFNILKWDIPFLLLQSQDHPRFPEFFKKINFSNVVDLFTILTFQNHGVIKGLGFYLDREGIPKDFPSDHDLVRSPDPPEFRKKLEAIHSLYWKLKESA